MFLRPKESSKTISGYYRGHLEPKLHFEKKKFPKMVKKCQKNWIFEISKFDFRPETYKLRPKCCREARLVPKSSQNLFS